MKVAVYEPVMDILISCGEGVGTGFSKFPSSLKSGVRIENLVEVPWRYRYGTFLSLKHGKWAEARDKANTWMSDSQIQVYIFFECFSNQLDTDASEYFLTTASRTNFSNKRFVVRSS